MFTKNKVRKFMRQELQDRDHPDLWVQGEVNFTRLAENAAWHFGHDEWLDNPDHWVWDLSCEEGERAQEAIEAEWTARQGGR